MSILFSSWYRWLGNMLWPCVRCACLFNALSLWSFGYSLSVLCIVRMSCDLWFSAKRDMKITYLQQPSPLRHAMPRHATHNETTQQKRTEQLYDFAPAIRKSTLFKRPQIKENWSHGSWRCSGACSISSCLDIFSILHCFRRLTSTHPRTPSHLHHTARWEFICVGCVRLLQIESKSHTFISDPLLLHRLEVSAWDVGKLMVTCDSTFYYEECVAWVFVCALCCLFSACFSEYSHSRLHYSSDTRSCVCVRKRQRARER